jgi:methyl-accepting chemotaxis protein
MANTTNDSLEKQLKPFLTQINLRADKIIGNALWVYFAFGLFLAPFYGTWMVALGVGSLCLLAYWIPRLVLPRYSLHRYVSSGVLAVFMAQFIYQMHGMFEMHFFAFVGCTLLIAYQNWKMQLPLIILMMVHYASLAYLQASGAEGIYFTRVDSMDLQTFVFHATIAALIVAICGIWSYRFGRHTLDAASQLHLYGQQTDNINNNIRFAEEISQGNLDVNFQADENDTLSKALLNMRQSLLVASEREKQEKFKTIGLAEVSEILRANNDLHQLADRVIVKLVKYMSANQGGLFILKNDDSAQPYLELVACYAFDRKKHMKKNLQIGEGLVGQAVLERDVIYLTEVPQDYIQITSGLGGSNPRSILIVPLLLNDKIEGAIELASFNEFQPFEIEFMQKLGESIASTIASVKINERTRHLLQESQMQSEQMRAQEEEMRQNMEELAATQEEMQRKNAEMESQTAAINFAMAGVEFNMDGTIIRANDKFLSVMGYSSDEVVGKHHRMFVSPEHAVSEEYQKLWQSLREGKLQSGDFVRFNKQKQSVWLKTSYVPAFDGQGEPYKVIKFAHDITPQKKMEADMSSKADELYQINEQMQAQEEAMKLSLRQMQQKQQEMEDLLQKSQENEERMQAQEEIMKQSLAEMDAIQEALREKAGELERVRAEEKNKVGALVQSQKKAMEETLRKQQQKEEQLVAEVVALKQELEQYRK